MSNQLVRAVLLIEDSEQDVFLFKRALSKAGFEGKLHVVDSVVAALDHLRVHDTPDLIVSDNALKGSCGLDVLKIIRAEPGWQQVPVVIYSSAISPADATRAIDSGATACIEKAVGLSDLVAQVRQLLEHMRPPS